MGKVCDIVDLRQAINYIESNSIGLLTSYNSHRVVSSYVPFIVSHKQGSNFPLSLFGIIKRKNTQWISLRYNDLILVIFGPEAFGDNIKSCEKPFHSLQVYGKVRLIDDYELIEIGNMISRRHDISEGLTHLERECVGFEFVVHEIHGITYPHNESRNKDFLKQFF